MKFELETSLMDFRQISTSRIEEFIKKPNAMIQVAKIEWTCEIKINSDGFSYMPKVKRVFFWYDYDNEQGDVQTDGHIMWQPMETLLETSSTSGFANYENVQVESVEIDFSNNQITLCV